MRWTVILATTAVCMTASAAHAACKIPSDVANYLSKDAGWKVVEETALSTADKALWTADHAGQCPGLAGAAIKGDGKAVWAAALLRTADGKLEQKLVLIEGPSATTLVEAKTVVRPAVIWVTAPGPQEEFKTKRVVTTQNPAFIVETLEAAMTVFYFADGKVQSLTLSD